VSLQELYERYHDRVQFLMVYIREAHPVDGWWLGRGLFNLALKMYRSQAATDVYDPQTIEERRAVAGRCDVALQYGIPTLVDGMDDAVNKAYAAWPTRLYLVGLDGRVVYGAGLGPFDFKPARLGQAIETYLAELDRQSVTIHG
jgi:hypothetical protein